MAEEEKVVQYFSRDFEWEELRDEVERNPKFSYHLSSFSPSISSPSPVDSDADAWRNFHRRHSTGTFFKERRYLLKEFPELIVFDGSIHVLEVGCGNGSTALPILRAKQNIIVYACDCSQDALDKAVEMVATSNFPSISHRFYPFLHDFSANRFPDWFLCSACQKCLLKKDFIFTPDANGEGLIRINEPASCCIGGIDYVTLIAMHILEAIMRDNFGISYICNPSCQLLIGLMQTWDNLVNLLSVDQDFSPRLLFHIIRCYIMLCSNERGCDIVVQGIPVALTNGTFCDMIEEFPIIGGLLVQLLLYVDKVNEETLPERRVCMLFLQKDACTNDLCSPDSVSSPKTPCRSIDLGKNSLSELPLEKNESSMSF